MATQTPLISNTRTNGRAPSVARGVRDLASDLIELSELQSQLLLADLRDGRSRMVKAAALLVTGPILALAALPVLLESGAGWLATEMEWPILPTQLAAAGLLLLVAGGLAWLGWSSIGQSFHTLSRSREELRENIRWLKHTLRSRPEEPAWPRD